jgi:hypothetical protein
MVETKRSPLRHVDIQTTIANNRNNMNVGEIQRNYKKQTNTATCNQQLLGLWDQTDAQLAHALYEQICSTTPNKTKIYKS